LRYLFITIDRLDNRTRLLNHIKTALEMGHRVTVIALGKYESRMFDFNVVGFRIPVNKGPLKFILFNLYLTRYLLLHQFDCLYLRGLWVVPGVFAASLFKKYLYIYDAHEYFAGITLVHQRFVRRIIWMAFEKWIIGRSKSVLTVSQPIAECYRQRYPVLQKITVIRNLPDYQLPSSQIPGFLRFPFEEKVVLFFGYLMKGRGLTKLMQAVCEIPDIQLLMVGEGELKTQLQAQAVSFNIASRVHFKPFVANKYLISFISQAHIGVSLLEPISDNHRYALPNKLFECIMAGLPILASDIVMHRHYIETYDVGMVVDPGSSTTIKEAIIDMLQDEQRWERWHQNCLTAAKDLNWQQEIDTLKAEYRTIDQWIKQSVG
jgi:glycosyltransferase involved in cell wall biosynthesis